MRNLQFIVNGQTLSAAGDFSKIPKGTKGYLKCTFNVSGRNDGAMVAVFNRANDEFAVKLDANNSCMVPNELTDYPIYKVRIAIVGPDYMLKTNQIAIRQEG